VPRSAVACSLRLQKPLPPHDGGSRLLLRCRAAAPGDGRGQHAQGPRPERNALEKKLSEATTTFASAESALHEKANHVERLDAKILDLEKYIEQLSTSNEQDQELVNRIRELTDKCDEKDRKYESLQNQLEEHVSAFKKSEEGLNYEATNLRKNVSDLTNQIEDLKQAKAGMEAELENSRENLAASTEAVNLLNTNVESLQKQNHTLLNDKQTHKSILKSLQNTLKETRSKLTR